MALAGAWLDANRAVTDTYPNAPRWGQPVSHGTPGGPGRGLSPGYSDANVFVDASLIGDDVSDYNDSWSYVPEDSPGVLYGYSFQTGTRDRPGWTEEAADTDRGTTDINGDHYPAYGGYIPGIPGGNDIRSYNHGADLSLNTKNNPDESAIYEEMFDPLQSEVSDAVVSDTSQLFMQTSMTQRDKVREGSQISGTASEYSAPIRSRIPAMRAKNFDSNKGRHYDMEPRSQDLIIRPFWNRTAGTDDRRKMASNEMYVSQSKFRVAPENPYPGQDVVQGASAVDYGYQTEDETW